MSKKNLFIRVSLCLLLVLGSIWTNTLRMSFCANEDLTEYSDTDSNEDDFMSKNVIEFYLFNNPSIQFSSIDLYTETHYAKFNLLSEVAEHQFCQSIEVEPPCCKLV